MIRFSSGAADGQKKRSFTLELSLSALITACIVTIIAFGWVFAFGVIVGRGYSPEKQMPAIAGLLPQPKQEVVPEAEILKPEDLTFMTDLKQKPGTAMQPTRLTQNATQPAAPAGAVTATRNGTKPASSPAGQTTPVQQPEGLFDFVLQVIAYKKSEQADSLRERLEGEGMRTRMAVEKAQGGKVRWYRVQVLFRGSDADLEAMRERLAKMGIKDASVLSRKAAGRSR